MKKSMLILVTALITLSAIFAFRTKSEIAPITAKNEKVSSTSNGSGFALQDQDQWK